MKSKVKKDEAQMSGVDDIKEFTIDTESSMIVSILRDKLYKNKVAAVCREIASNGRDANREAGREKTPINITIHKDSDDFLGNNSTLISFKDNGIGVTPDRMDKIFLKYGGSTKRDSNSQTGGFGIGAKTPFAYTDNFLITTVCEHKGKKMKYQYQAVIIADGIKERTQLVLIDSNEVNEVTGTTITVPIGSDESSFNVSDRINDFEWECLHATAMWEVKPNFVGFKNEHLVNNKELEVVKKGKGWKIVKDPNNILNATNRNIVAAVDGIPYPISNNEIKDVEFRDSLISFISNYSRPSFVIVLEIETGEVTLSASREDVEYITENLRVFFDAYKKLKDTLENEIYQILDKAKSKIEKGVIYNSIMRNISDYTIYYQLLSENRKIQNEIFKKIKDADVPTKYSDITDNNFDLVVFNTQYKSQMTKLQGTISMDRLKLKVLYRDRNSCSLRNETLLEEGHTNVLFIMPKKSGRDYIINEKTDKSLARMKELLKEIDVEVGNYENVKKAERMKVAGSSKAKADLVMVPLRRCPGGVNAEWQADSIYCNKKDNTPHEPLADDDSKVVIMYVDSVTMLNNQWKDEIQVFGDTKDLPQWAKEYVQSNQVWSKVFKMLELLGYKVFATSKNKSKYFKNKKYKGISDIKKILNKEYLKQEDLQYAIQDYIDYYAAQKIDLASELDNKFLTYPKYLKLANISQDIIEKSTKVLDVSLSGEARDLSYAFREEQILLMAKTLKLKSKDYGVDLTYQDVEEALDSIEVKYPKIHFLFNMIGDWYTDNYIANYGGGEENFWRTMVEPLIDEALSKSEKKS